MFEKKLLIAILFATPAFAMAGEYKVDPDHTYPSFEFPHMGISVWRGKFNDSRGSIRLDREARTGTVDIVVDTASVDFGMDLMNEHARSADWFDVAKFPQATYTGTLEFTGDAPTAVNGEFTFRGVTRPLTLAINSFNCIEHPVFKKEVCGADASSEVNWSEFGMTFSEYGKGDAGRTTLRIQVEALKQDEATREVK